MGKEKSPVVETLSGSVDGIVSKSREGKEFYEYLGIPYAKPPVGDLRFEPPEPVEKWEGIRDGSRYGNISLQMDSIKRKPVGSEDCLFLNIFTPKLRKKDELFPVMVWIHGGMFVFGSSNMYRPEYFMDHDIVLVTLNYRLGCLGFLNTGDEVVRGNMGLKDQNMALKWIQMNINTFGGNPDWVTIFGESAGGASVHHHVLSPLSKGLFWRAISQSGTGLPKWAFRTNPGEQAKRFAKLLALPQDNTKEFVNTLKSMDATKILEVSSAELKDSLREPISVFNPSIEHVKDQNAFITELPIDLLRKGDFNKVPFLTGVNSHEGLLTTTPLLRDSKLKEVSENYKTHLPKLIWWIGKPDPEKLKQLKDFYIGEDEENNVKDHNSLENYLKWSNLFTDTGFAAPAQKTISLQSEHSPVYAYYYSYKGEFTLTDYLIAMSGKYPPLIEFTTYFLPRWFRKKFLGIQPQHHGACHFDEVALEFPLKLLNTFIKPTEKDYQMSKAMVKAWVQFASDLDTGKPLEFDGISWPAANSDGPDIPLKYLHMDTESRLVDEPNAERNTFWNTLGMTDPFTPTGSVKIVMVETQDK